MTSDTPLGQREEDDLRLSIAGAQEKPALLRIGRRWHRPTRRNADDPHPELPLGLVGNMRADMSTSVENQWLCARLLRALGLPVADTKMACFRAAKVLAVTRFDRRWGGIRRVAKCR